MTDFEMLKEMLQMQYDYDTAVNKEKKIDKIKDYQRFFAIFDELGELSHELKADWCWWKIHCEKIFEKMREEYIDVVHFALGYEIEHIKYLIEVVEMSDEKIKNNLEMALLNTKRSIVEPEEGEELLDVIMEDFKEIVARTCTKRWVLWEVLGLGFDLGFTMEEIYEEYKNKNKINHERLKNGY